MAEIRKREEITNSIYDLIIETKEILVIISPYIKLNDDFKKAILSLKNLNLIIFVFRRKDIDENTYKFLGNLTNSILYTNDFLHTKCYINEEKAIITSLNLYKYSMENNFELAVEFKNKIDTKNYEEIKSETHFIIERSICLNEQKLKYLMNDGNVVHCTSCTKNIIPKLYEEKIEYGIWRKEHLCQNCISDFENFEKQNNEIEIIKRYGKFCVVCGNKNDNSMSINMGLAPICSKCIGKITSPINKNKIGRENK